MKRDSYNMFGNETFSVVLDTFYDRRNGFNFITNALGALFDATITNERTPNLDWNAVWTCGPAASSRAGPWRWRFPSSRSATGPAPRRSGASTSSATWLPRTRRPS